jgi:hypothetical protein
MVVNWVGKMYETDDVESEQLAREVEKFRGTLLEKMRERNWKQKDLARAAFGEKIDEKGNAIPIGAERISAYMTGRAKPSEQSVHELARALDMSPMDLAPWLLRDSFMKEPQSTPGKPDKTTQSVYLSIECMVSEATARKIYDLIRQEKVHLNLRLTDKPG